MNAERPREQVVCVESGKFRISEAGCENRQEKTHVWSTMDQDLPINTSPTQDKDTSKDVPDSAVHALKCFEPCEGLQVDIGDIIEIDRLLFSHWAVYIGDGRVIHVCNFKTSSPEFQTSSEIVEEDLKVVAGPSLVRVNNKEVPAMQRNLSSLHPKLIVENAKKCVHEKVSHNVMSLTAEHFVTSCRYGVGWSDQATAIASVLTKRSRPTRQRNRSGKEHPMLLRRVGDRKDGHKMQEGGKEKREATLAPLVKGLADIFKHKLPSNQSQP